ncbi:ELL-associated factor 1-like isoform X2 [Actinia tenebrosa]|uniref:ELL-associated factor 1-like isoform X2 n=1 Tax=Actinia tenebrosa TaxID=6105 RepID=A0A6P8H2D9_ACTTE|nr:ELL-associated factor 1-like isoform X2 [Actinia tenebrosa]
MADAEGKFSFVTEGEHELILGSSLNQNAKQEYAFHTIRYDFKPASVDSTKASELVVGDKSEVTITVPHIQDSGATVYKGSKRPCPKEFLLIIDKKTQTFTLERIGSTSQMKKIRSANPVKLNKAQASSSTSILPETKTTKKIKSNSTKTKKHHQQEPSLSSSQVQESLTIQKTEPTENTELLESADSSSSSDSSSSDSENEDKNDDDDDDDNDDDDDDDDEEDDGDDDKIDDKHVEQLNSILNCLDSEPKPTEFNQLSQDLHLSESGSDSD